MYLKIKAIYLKVTTGQVVNLKINLDPATARIANPSILKEVQNEIERNQWCYFWHNRGCLLGCVRKNKP